MLKLHCKKKLGQICSSCVIGKLCPGRCFVSATQLLGLRRQSARKHCLGKTQIPNFILKRLGTIVSLANAISVSGARFVWLLNRFKIKRWMESFRSYLPKSFRRSNLIFLISSQRPQTNVLPQLLSAL